METEESDLTLSECVDILQQDDPVGKKFFTTGDGKALLETLQEKASKEGLTEEQIIQLVHVAASRKYSDVVATSIIKSLIPRDYVPAASFVNIVSWICTKLLSVNLQVSFLKWLILVYEWVDDKTTVHSLYGILFLFIDNEALSPDICHLLYYMTIKEDVKSFRLKKLMELLVKLGARPHLLGLLSIYKLYSPHLVALNIPKTRKAFFKRKDAKWLDIVWKVKSLKEGRAEKAFSSALNKDSILSFPAAKTRRKDVIIPYIQPSAIDQAEGSRITIDQIKTFKEFLTHFDELELPAQMGTVLRSPYVQHLMVCTQDEGAFLRFNFWLHQTLYEELVSAPSGRTSERVAKFLDALFNFVSFLKAPIPSLETCLSQYLPTWNGVDYQSHILLLVSQLHIQPFHKLNDLILEPIRKLFFSSSVQFKCQVLSCFTEMLLSMANSTLTFFLKEESSFVDSTKSPLSNLPKSETSKWQRSQVLKDFIGFVDKICVVALQLESDHVLLAHWVLCFFEQVSILRQEYNIPFVRIPSPDIIYRSLFATNSMACSRVCQLIVNYKEGFESLKCAKLNGDVETSDFLDGFDNINQFNQYILDISDSLWRNKAFTDRTKSLCYSIPRPVTDALEIPYINERFSIPNHIAFVYLAKKFLMLTQPEDIKLNPNLIRGKVRASYMEFLKRNYLDGIVSFITTFIKPQSKNL